MLGAPSCCAFASRPGHRLPSGAGPACTPQPGPGLHGGRRHIPARGAPRARAAHDAALQHPFHRAVRQPHHQVGGSWPAHRCSKAQPRCLRRCLRCIVTECLCTTRLAPGPRRPPSWPLPHQHCLPSRLSQAAWALMKALQHTALPWHATRAAVAAAVNARPSRQAPLVAWL